MNTVYEPRQELKPKNLDGIGEDQIAQHWALYEGYVKNVNLLTKTLAGLSEKKDFGVEFSELKRRLAFEYDGMVLHEHYFGILKAGQPIPVESAALTKAFKQDFGGFKNWKEEFAAMGKMRGIGWVILYADPRRRTLTNFWIGMHESGHPVGLVPLLVMDIWEHAYMVDGGAGDRATYVEKFLNNVDWPKVEITLAEVLGRSPAAAHPAAR
jgi:Fe-Mn family superoxide dismutase